MVTALDRNARILSTLGIENKFLGVRFTVGQSISFTFSIFRMVRLFLLQILVSGLCQRRKSHISYVLFSVLIKIPFFLVVENTVVGNSIDPSFVFIAVQTMSIALMGHIVVHSRFYQKIKLY